MILLQALLEIDMFEHGSANPFVSLVSSVEFRINQLKGASIDSPLAKKSFVSQLSNLLQLLGSVKKWTVPQDDIRKELDLAVKEATECINNAIESIEKGNNSMAIKHLMTAREQLVQHSHLEFN